MSLKSQLKKVNCIQFAFFFALIFLTFSLCVSLHSDTDSNYKAFYTLPLNYSYLIITNNLAITQNLRSRWRVKRFRCQVTKVKDIEILIGYPRC